jgi:hypothetical protein
MHACLNAIDNVANVGTSYSHIKKKYYGFGYNV